MAFEIPERALRAGATSSSLTFAEIVDKGQSFSAHGESRIASSLPSVHLASDDAVIPGGAFGTEVPIKPIPIEPLDKLPEPYEGPEKLDPAAGKMRPGGGAA